MLMAFVEDRRALTAFERASAEALGINQLPDTALIEEIQCRAQSGDGPTAFGRLDSEIANNVRLFLSLELLGDRQ